MPDYLVILADESAQAPFMALKAGGFGSTPIVSNKESVVVKAVDLYAVIAGVATASLGTGVYYGYAGFTQAVYDSVFNGAKFLRVDCELVNINVVATAAPTSANKAAKIGDIIYNANPAAGGSLGWVCVADGAPGTWKTFGTISA